MFRLNMVRQAFCARPNISNAIYNTILRRAVHVSSTLHSRYPRSSYSHRNSCSCKEGNIKSTIPSEKPRSDGKTIIMSKRSQSKENNAFSNHTTMNLGTETMNQSTTAHVDFEIISTECFATESKRNRSDTFPDIERNVEEGFADRSKTMDEDFADILRTMEDGFTRLEKNQNRILNVSLLPTLCTNFNMDKATFAVVVLITILPTLEVWYESVLLNSDLEKRDLILKDGKVLK
ncbi:hypothetical protein V501_01874 [Pseudogymnoascus sp. VKM F-4519 (FW-2642)]|nr:hypothetical protein V501_01874 [Pseudogymnoascus sp. VKM F-4519 (FW-2642)]